MKHRKENIASPNSVAILANFAADSFYPKRAYSIVVSPLTAGVIPNRIAAVAASVRLLTPSFAKIFVKCVCTVFSLIYRSLLIS